MLTSLMISVKGGPSPWRRTAADVVCSGTGSHETCRAAVTLQALCKLLSTSLRRMLCCSQAIAGFSMGLACPAHPEHIHIRPTAFLKHNQHHSGEVSGPYLFTQHDTIQKIAP